MPSLTLFAPQWVDKFVQAALSQANHTRTEHQMWACGSDFQYQNADHWYHNLDKVRAPLGRGSPDSWKYTRHFSLVISPDS